MDNVATAESPAFRRGVMALKSQRFEEAENYFIEEAEHSNSALAWVAAGKAKLGRVPTGEVSIEEVAYCFDLARGSCTDANESESVESMLGASLLQTIQHLYFVLDQLRRAGHETSARGLSAIAVGGASAVVGTNARSAFGTLASYDIFSRSADALEASISDMDDVVDTGRRMIALLLQLREFLASQGADHASNLAALEAQPELAALSAEVLGISGVNDEVSTPTNSEAGVSGCAILLGLGVAYVIIYNLIEEPVYTLLALGLFGLFKLLKAQAPTG